MIYDDYYESCRSPRNVIKHPAAVLSSKTPRKNKILDGFVAATGYDRKYALVLLCKKSSSTDIASLKPKSRPGAQVYDDQFRHVLIKVWNTANQVCSKRFVPFIPDLVAAMERHGHLRISDDIRKKLMTVSAATVDRILQPERYRQVQGLSQTKAGALLKSKIQVRTFADWNDIVPGFYEVDLEMLRILLLVSYERKTDLLTFSQLQLVTSRPVIRECGCR